MGFGSNASRQPAHPILDVIKTVPEKAFLDMQLSGPQVPYPSIRQGPTEHFVQFIEKLTTAIEQ